MNDKFLVFLYDNYYPCGAEYDFRGAFDTYKEALSYIRGPGAYDNALILDVRGGNWHGFSHDKYENKWTKDKEKEGI